MVKTTKEAESKCHVITNEQLEAKHTKFLEKEPRDLFYRTALFMIEQIWVSGKNTSFNLAEAVSILLLTWNKSFYRFHPFTEEHVHDIEVLISETLHKIKIYKDRSIKEIQKEESSEIVELFKSFEEKLGAVGAAKALHLLAPNFFPLWDNKIATAYGLSLGKKGENGEKYFQLALYQKEQVMQLGEMKENVSILKLIDEYNYCEFTKNCG